MSAPLAAKNFSTKWLLDWDSPPGRKFHFAAKVLFAGFPETNPAISNHTALKSDESSLSTIRTGPSGRHTISRTVSSASLNARARAATPLA
jgi:hypothetical protein